MLSNTFLKAETAARNAEAAISTTSSSKRLEATIKAAELYFKALRLVESPVERKKIDLKCKSLLDQAESLRSHEESGIPNGAPSASVRDDLPFPTGTRFLTTREKIILLEGSKLNGFIFRPWDREPQAEDFELKRGETLYQDDPALPLSESQMKCFRGWKRPDDALIDVQIVRDGLTLPNEPVMTTEGDIDLVQDLTSDCSVIASLCAGISRAARGHPKILRAIVRPYDNDRDCIMVSATGRYVLRFWFNGCWRRVEIDDLLPTSTNERLLHVIDRNHPELLWPALVEKAYLKVRGGYDFPGSNSGTDLAVLTGWIPQQIFLHDEDIEPETLWKKLRQAFDAGDLLLTMGTGKLSEREQRELGLAALHDYAILDIREQDHRREFLVKNPWADGDVWKGAARRRSNHPPEDVSGGLDAELNEGSREDLLMAPGTFWIDFASIFQYFENLYISWNPGLFSYRQDHHFTWDIGETNPTINIFIKNPQFSFKASQSGEVWVQLNRHFRTGDYTRASGGKYGHISLYLFTQTGKRIITSGKPLIKGPYVDSPNALLIFDALAGQPYTIVASSYDLQPERYNFTLSALSHASVTLEVAENHLPFVAKLEAAWTSSTAGGNSDCGTYLTNPQFSLSITHEAEMALILRVPSLAKPSKHDLHVKILVLASDGKRVTRLRVRDVVANSGGYRRSNAVIETKLPAGKYNIICSTFDPGQCGKFTLTLYTPEERTARLRLLPPEGSGRLSIFSQRAIFSQDCNRLLAPIHQSRTTKAIFIVRNGSHVYDPKKQQSPNSNNSLYKMSLERGQGPYKTLLSSSVVGETEYNSLVNGVRIEDIDLEADLSNDRTSGLWLVLERMTRSAHDSSDTNAETVQVEVLTEERIQLGEWGYGDG